MNDNSEITLKEEIVKPKKNLIYKDYKLKLDLNTKINKSRNNLNEGS